MKATKANKTTIDDRLQELIGIFARKQECLEKSIEVGVEESVTTAEILVLAQNLINDIAKVKRIRSMLDDLKSMVSEIE
jgi:phosphopantetheinyl transferase (holo-ACP synthase)